MKPQLNHTIVSALDQRESAEFLAEMMGFDPSGHFLEILTRPYGSGPAR